MAFWKKSDDPWDRKPEKRKETVWYEQDAPKEVNSVGEDTIRPIEDAELAECCPWCGKPMLLGHVDGGRDAVFWKEGKWKSVLVALFDEHTPRQMRIKDTAAVWYCETCEKLIAAVSGLALPVAQQKTSFHEYLDQWKETEAREEEARRKKRGE